MYVSSDSDEDQIIQNVINLRRPRLYRPRINFQNDPTFVERFRLSPGVAEELLRRIGPRIEGNTNRATDLSASQKLLTALNFYASDSFYHCVGDSHGLSKASIHRCVKSVTSAINAELFHEVINWDLQPNVPERFHAMAGMPTVCGCIDGSHINISTPSENEANYVNRKNDHSINTMMVCDPVMKFQFVSARWPGSVHDSRVLRNSNIFRDFELNNWRPFRNAVLLGDSGYPLKDYLIVPITRPNNEQERRFNRAHKSTRRIIECAFGCLKERFTCLKMLRVKDTVFACDIIKTCCILHNLCINDNAVPINVNAIEVDSDHESDDEENENLPVRNIRRDQLVQFF